MAFVPGYGLRAAGDEVLHDHLLLYHVGVQVLSLCFPDPCPASGPMGVPGLECLQTGLFVGSFTLLYFTAANKLRIR